MESSPTSTSGQERQVELPEHVVEQLQSLEHATMRNSDHSDQAARKLRTKNALLRRFPQERDETPESLTMAVSNFVGKDCFKTDAVTAKVKCLPNKREDAASPGVVLTEFRSVAEKKKIFRARANLAGSNIGLDDDLTPLQQKQKSAAWPAFKEAKANNQQTRWEAEKLFIKQGSEWVVHQVCAY